MTLSTYSYSSEVLYFCANYIDSTVVTSIKLQHPGLIEFRSAKKTCFLQVISVHAKGNLEDTNIYETVNQEIKKETYSNIVE